MENSRNLECKNNRYNIDTCLRLALTLNRVASNIVRIKPIRVQRQTSDCRFMPTQDNRFNIFQQINYYILNSENCYKVISIGLLFQKIFYAQRLYILEAIFDCVLLRVYIINYIIMYTIIVTKNRSILIFVYSLIIDSILVSLIMQVYRAQICCIEYIKGHIKGLKLLRQFL